MNIPELVIKQTFPVMLEQMFKAWTDAEQMAAWFFVQKDWSARVKNDLRVDGSYAVDMVGAKGEVHHHHGKYQEIVPSTRLSFTWNSSHTANTLVVLSFKDVYGQTELTLTHKFFKNMHEYEAHRPGWIGCLENLETFFQRH